MRDRIGDVRSLHRLITRSKELRSFPDGTRSTRLSTTCLHPEPLRLHPRGNGGDRSAQRFPQRDAPHLRPAISKTLHRPVRTTVAFAATPLTSRERARARECEQPVSPRPWKGRAPPPKALRRRTGRRPRLSARMGRWIRRAAWTHRLTGLRIWSLRSRRLAWRRLSRSWLRWGLWRRKCAQVRERRSLTILRCVHHT